MSRRIDDFRPETADRIAFFDRGKGINVPDVQSAIEKVYGEINRTNPTLEITSVKDFGAKGDGVSDDTQAIQNAITSTAGEVYFPPGKYVVTEPIILKSNLKISGSGVGSIIHASLSSPGDIFKTNTAPGTSMKNIQIASLNIHAENNVINSISFIHTLRSTISNCLFTGNISGAGIYMNYSWGNRVNDCYFDNDFYGKYCIKAEDTSNALNIVGVYTSTFADYGIFFTGGHGLTITGSTIQSHAVAGIEVQDSVTGGVAINGNYFEANKKDIICGDWDTKSFVAGVSIIGNTITRTKEASIIMDYVSGFFISANVILGDTQNRIVLNRANNGVIAQNKMRTDTISESQLDFIRKVPDALVNGVQIQDKSNIIIQNGDTTPYKFWKLSVNINGEISTDEWEILEPSTT